MNSGAPVQVGQRRNPDSTIYVGDLDPQVDEEILWELFLQVGPVAYTHIPRDKVTGQHQGFGFVEFAQEWDAEYAQKVMPGVKLFGKAIRVNRASQASRKGASALDVGANLFIGNLSQEVDERMLYDTFSRFGVILSTPKIMRDPETQEHKGFAFVQFADFDASDAAIASLNGQYVAGRPINVQYALKKDSKDERHGSEAERLLATQRRAQMGQQMGAPIPQQRPLAGPGQGMGMGMGIGMGMGMGMGAPMHQAAPVMPPPPQMGFVGGGGGGYGMPVPPPVAGAIPIYGGGVGGGYGGGMPPQFAQQQPPYFAQPQQQQQYMGGQQPQFVQQPFPPGGLPGAHYVLPTNAQYPGMRPQVQLPGQQQMQNH